MSYNLCEAPTTATMANEYNIILHGKSQSKETTNLYNEIGFNPSENERMMMKKMLLQQNERCAVCAVVSMYFGCI